MIDIIKIGRKEYSPLLVNKATIVEKKTHKINDLRIKLLIRMKITWKNFRYFNPSYFNSFVKNQYIQS